MNFIKVTLISLEMNCKFLHSTIERKTLKTNINKMDFNKKKFLALLKERKSLKKESKFLWDYDKAKNKELVEYLTLLDDQIFWQSRKEYCQMLDLFVRKKITLDEFFNQFYGLRGSNLRSAKMWEENLEAEACGIVTKSNEIDFQLNPEACGFTEVISDLHSLINLCDPDITLEMNFKNPELLLYGISEEFLRLDLKDNYLPRIGEYCKES